MCILAWHCMMLLSWSDSQVFIVWRAHGLPRLQMLFWQNSAEHDLHRLLQWILIKLLPMDYFDSSPAKLIVHTLKERGVS